MAESIARNSISYSRYDTDFSQSCFFYALVDYSRLYPDWECDLHHHLATTIPPTSFTLGWHALFWSMDTFDGCHALHCCSWDNTEIVPLTLYSHANHCSRCIRSSTTSFLTFAVYLAPSIERHGYY